MNTPLPPPPFFTFVCLLYFSLSCPLLAKEYIYMYSMNQSTFFRRYSSQCREQPGPSGFIPARRGTQVTVSCAEIFKLKLKLNVCQWHHDSLEPRDMVPALAILLPLNLPLTSDLGCFTLNRPDVTGMELAEDHFQVVEFSDHILNPACSAINSLAFVDEVTCLVLLVPRKLSLLESIPCLMYCTSLVRYSTGYPATYGVAMVGTQ
jgi:hypothetical protein